ncbi:MAG: translational GTPase TypA, partial [Clostridiales bacterium]|nr:translational GTPase TypA [Clostridiales bacterium]
MLRERMDVRNVAIIAHVDHGKTTLVDELLKQSGVFRRNQVIKERVMDSNDLERERGITILAKNTAVFYNNVKINIVDTPGHADFGGEVERVMKMVDGVVLVVDAFEGPMPQTKFVLKNALDVNLPVVVCINKIDRPDARPRDVVDEVLELFMELDASNDQIDAPFVYASAKKGVAFVELDAEGQDMKPLFDAILESIPAPKGDPDVDFQILITTIDYNDYVGRIGIGKVENGIVHANDETILVNIHDPDKARRFKISKLFEFEGLNRIDVLSAEFGSIVAVSGVDDIKIGDTLCGAGNPVPLPFSRISEPTLSMNFTVNDSPFAGQEGRYVTSRHLRSRIFRELNTDVSLRVEETDTTESFKVSGRGELHLSILIENMRREGYEFQVSKPEVIYRNENGVLLEPIEIVTIDAPEEFCGIIIERLGSRRAMMTRMTPANGGYTRLIFEIPARGLIGYRAEFLTDTKGNGIMNSIFKDYEPYRGDIQTRRLGSLIAYETGEAVPYGLYGAQERGELFIGAGVWVYAGMVVGRNARGGDIEVNVCKRKQLTNMRASSADDALRLITPAVLSLEQSL